LRDGLVEKDERVESRKVLKVNSATE